MTEQKFKELKKTTEVFVENLNGFASKVSDADTIGLKEDSRIVAHNAEDFRKGIFKILIMGAFKTGKSTLLNSIIGTKLVATRAISCTAIITLIVYGEETDKVTIYFKDKEPEILSKDEYLKKYRLEIEDEEEIEATGMATRFENVEFAIVNSQYELFKSGVRFIDSPGLEDRLSCNETTHNFVPKANAIIYTLNALQLFTKHDKEYIRNNFRDKLNENVFFVVNNINRLNTDEDRQDVMDKTRSYLKKCFVNPDGSFNEEMYSKRVFFVNALQALDSKVKTAAELTNRYSTSDKGQLYHESGVQRLEDEMQNFVSTDTRLKSAIRTNLETLASIYMKAQDKVAVDLKALKLPLGQLEKNAKEAERVLKKAKQDFQQIDTSFTLAKNSIFLKLTKSFNEMVLDMEDNWEAMTEDFENTLKAFDLVKLAGKTIMSIGNKEKQKEKMAQLMGPFISEIQQLVEANVDTWAKNKIPVITEKDLAKLQEAVNESIHNTNTQINIAKDIFAGNGEQADADNEMKMNYLQLIISVLQGDPSLLIENVGAGGMPWGEFIKKTIMQIMAMVIISSIFTGGLALILIAIWEVLNLNKGAQDLNKKILLKVKETLFTELRKVNFSDFEDKIWGPIDSQRLEILQNVANQIDEIIANQNIILQEHRSQEFNIKDKEEKVEKGLKMMREYIANIYQQAYGAPLTDQDIKTLANR